MFLHGKGMDVTLVGRKLDNSFGLDVPFKHFRMRLVFNKGPLFYAEYNIRLFFYLLYKCPNLLVSNDLDTLLANYWASGITGADLVYDSHEYFTEVPELIKRPRVRRVWREIEEFVFPHLRHVYTVNKSIAGKYRRRYGVDVKVVRNLPFKAKLENPKSKSELGIPENKPIVILQGAWINIDRGGEEAVQAMQYVDAVLLVCGGGDALPELHRLVDKLGLANKVIFKPRMPYKELRHFTHYADLGLSLDKSTNPNYKYSLPNKLFDYIHASTPVLVSDLVEVKRVVKQYNVGVICNLHNPKVIADKINQTLSNKAGLLQMKQNCEKAKEELNWQAEEVVLEEIYEFFLSRHNK